MTITQHPTETAAVTGEPLELLRAMLEEQFVVQTNRLTELTIYGRLPGHGGYDPHMLDLLAAAARRSIADTAQALRRMSEGTYGHCANCRRPIPLGRLRSVPQATHCTRCDQPGRGPT
ncbi:TraR/DksA C4-type zinc finger protein [Couchioplanes caeruleus]|uniref:TraR/DksA family transcriptional regulator n=1 Tax=Couchioplanes caeruleus TaxID=56438 RepID=UPI00209AC49C|nr:TraR/DksA C4-type zinc finger protein [Couchioplanes caeruleus]UQU64633.1 TraR/DksA C4-type zinc finger protein [Couchioplanes caeruleus]